MLMQIYVLSALSFSAKITDQKSVRHVDLFKMCLYVAQILPLCCLLSIYKYLYLYVLLLALRLWSTPGIYCSAGRELSNIL